MSNNNSNMSQDVPSTPPQVRHNYNSDSSPPPIATPSRLHKILNTPSRLASMINSAIRSHKTPNNKRRKKEDVDKAQQKEQIIDALGNGLIQCGECCYYYHSCTDNHILLRCRDKENCDSCVKMFYYTNSSRSSYSSGGSLDASRYSLERIHSPLCRQNPLLTCPSNKFLSGMVHYLFTYTKLNNHTIDSTSTVGHYRRRREDFNSFFKEKKVTQSSTKIPKVFFNRDLSGIKFNPSKAVKDETTNFISEFAASERLSMLAAHRARPDTATAEKFYELPSWSGLSCDTNTFFGGCWEAYGMTNETDNGVLMNAIVPLFREKTHYEWKQLKGNGSYVHGSNNNNTVFYNGNEYDVDDFDQNTDRGEWLFYVHEHKTPRYRINKAFATPSIIFFNGEQYKVCDFVLKTDKKGLFYVDNKNILGLGKGMAFTRVGNHMEDKYLDIAKTVCAEISPDDNPSKLLPFILLICCQFHYKKFGKDGIRDKTRKLNDAWERMSGEEEALRDQTVVKVKSFVDHLRESFVQCINPQVDKASEIFDRILWEPWSPLAKHYDKCRREEDIFDTSSISEEVVRKGLNFHYAVIIAISQASEDEVTYRNFIRIMDGICTPMDFLKQLKDMELAEIIEVLYEIMRDGPGLMGTRLLPIFELAVVSAVLFDGDVGTMGSEDLRSISQLDFKKQAIIQNVIASMESEEKAITGFSEVGGDTHVRRVIQIIAKLLWEHRWENGDYKGEWERVWRNDLTMQYVLHHIGHEVGYFTNELLAQYGQLLDRGSLDRQKELVVNIRAKMIEKSNDYGQVFAEWENQTRKDRRSKKEGN